jgi:organic radical activating enzyme
MTFEEAVPLMRGPRNMHIICVDVTNKCDLDCSNCTRLLANQDALWEMTPENFRTALRSLKDYFGIIAMLGGNPCMHSKFPELCQIFVEEIPNRLQRGLWTNNPFKHEDVARETFGTFNLNAHGVERAQPALQRLTDAARTNDRIAWTYMGHSVHAPLLTAVKDVYGDSDMWKKITECDINREWSASIVQNKDGELRAYFCEVAAAFDLARGGDHGHPVSPGWWQQKIEAFSDQIKHFCPGCGVPAKMKGCADKEEKDTYTRSNADIAVKRKTRNAVLMERVEFDVPGHRATHYGQIT